MNAAKWSRRLLALLFFLAVFSGLFAPFLWAQVRRNTGGLPSSLNRPIRPGAAASDLRARSIVHGGGKYLPSSVPVRSLAGIEGGGARTRVRIGGPGGAVLAEQIINVTNSNPPDEVTPFWTADQRQIFFASNEQTNRYQLYRVEASASADPNAVVPATRTRITNDANADYLFPAVSPSQNRIAFLRSTDDQPVYIAGTTQLNPNKRYNLFIANLPSSGAISLTGALSVTEQPISGFTFSNAGRPAWLGTSFVVFSAQRADDPSGNFHLFRVDTLSGLIVQLTDGPASEQNAAGSLDPNGSFIAFDSNATTYDVGGQPSQFINGVFQVNDPSTAQGVQATRNIFVLNRQGGSPTPAAGNNTPFTNAAGSHVQPAWSFQRINPRTNPNNRNVFLAFASTRREVRQNAGDPGSPITGYTAGSTYDIYYVPALDPADQQLQTVLKEGAPGGANFARKLDTVDPAFRYNDEYPAWSPFETIFRLAHQSDRTGTLNATESNIFNTDTFTPTPDRHDVFITTLVDFTAPTLIRYDTSKPDGEIVHINLGNAFLPGTVNSVRTPSEGITAGGQLFFTVRVDDRESGMRPDRAVFLQFKNPNSKYQQTGNVEHKEWTTGDPSIGIIVNSLNVEGTVYPFQIQGAPSILFGWEYECQAISAATYTYFYHSLTAGTINPPPAGASFALYTAAVNDTQAFSGSNNPPLDGVGGTANVWLRLDRLPDAQQDGQGGVLYGATWRAPSEFSDWYIDVIAYDNATNPLNANQRYNWIIYDNVWGFSTAPFSGVETILVVADHTLGQKFFIPTLGSKFTAGGFSSNLQSGLFYGSESYHTDKDIARIPINLLKTATDTMATPYAGDNAPSPPGAATGLDNVLGVNSTPFTAPGEIRTGTDNRARPLPPAARYNIWRVLSRGPIPLSILLENYTPRDAQRPADIAADNPESGVQNVRVWDRCVVWTSPFSDTLFAGPGSIRDVNTQQNLTTFINAGGRLFINGQDIGRALTSNGAVANAFFTNVLRARYLNDGGAPTQLTATPGAPDNTIITSSANLTGVVIPFLEPAPSPAFPPLRTIDTAPTSFSSDTVAPIQAAPAAQFNSGFTQFTYDTGAQIISSQFDNNNDGQRDGWVVYSSAGFESIGYDWFEANSAIRNRNRPPQLMHNITNEFRTGRIIGRVVNLTQGNTPLENVLVRAIPAGANVTARAVSTAATDPAGNYQIVGLRPGNYTVVAVRAGFAPARSAGTVNVKGGWLAELNLSLPEVQPGNLRGTVFAADGVTPIPGIEVQLRVENVGSSPTTFTVFRATSQADGTYTFNNIPVTRYILIANPSDDVGPDGTIVPTNPNHRPTLETIVATDPASPKIRLGANTQIIGGRVVIDAAETEEVSFLLGSQPTTISGKVFRRDTPNGPQIPVPGATVTATQPGTDGQPVTLGSTTTDAQGNYTLGNIPGGEVTLTARAPGFLPGTKTVSVIGQPITSPEGDIELQPAPPTIISGLVTNAVTGQPFVGVTVQLFRTADLAADPNAAPVQAVTTTAAQTSSDGTYTYNYVFAPTPANDYIIRVVPPSAVYTVVPPERRAVVAGEAELRGQNFQIQPPGSVSGLVTLATGSDAQPVAGATVRLFRADTLALVTETVTFAPAATGANNYVFNYRIADVAPGSYVVQVFREGLTSDPVQIAITVTSGQETQNVNFRLLPLKVFGPGLQLIATPFDYSDRPTRSVFGLTPDQPAYAVFNVAEWLPQQNDYLIGPDIRLVPGKGYFVRFGDVASVQVRGRAAVPPGSVFDLTLPVGWNLIGNPFDPGTDVPNDGSLDISQILVLSLSNPNPNRPDGTYTMAEAAAAGLVRNVVFSYTGSTGGSQYVQGSILRPWIGYWFRAFQPVTLRMPPPASTRSATAAGATRAQRTITRAEADATRFRAITSKGAKDWRLQIAARQGDLLDTDNSIGVAPGARDGLDTRFDTEKPPKISGAPSLYLAFIGQDAQGRTRALTDDIRSSEGNAARTWPFTVAADGEGEVTLTVPNVARLPRGLTPYLVDVETGRRVNLRSSPAYRYTPGGRAARAFRIEIRQPISAPLAISDVKVLRSGSGATRAAMSGFRFSFRTTQEANVQVEVQTLTGRTVRRLQTRSVAVEENAVTWDGRGPEGQALPIGAYILRLTAQDDEGNIVRVQRPIMSIR